MVEDGSKSSKLQRQRYLPLDNQTPSGPRDKPGKRELGRGALQHFPKAVRAGTPRHFPLPACPGTPQNHRTQTDNPPATIWVECWERRGLRWLGYSQHRFDIILLHTRRHSLHHHQIRRYPKGVGIRQSTHSKFERKCPGFPRFCS